ncbi:cache domain-containing protein [Rhodoferax aquaticus]|uniref:Histidine kinase n=1 Tax=Rhodoferax aquaticus TaxID=2527691 RepID=A0A515EQX4_9BURK|nr:cache domain-containing protein [Rhodoferax aquaticus]QDL55067.1 histidine kinase [Rhodoferax aquaticus]
MVRLLGKRLCCLIVGLFLTLAHGSESQQAQEVEALVKNAIAYVKANGKEAALREFVNPKGAFIKGDLYLFVYNAQGVALAHINDKMIGKNMLDLRDADGKLVIKTVLSLGNSKSGKGWQTYKWPNPVTKEVSVKRSYTERYEGLYISSGYYK